jgi:undecaprenyl-diphosphatase
MLEQLNEWDMQLFLFLNGQHNSFLDVVMYWVTDKLFWIPLYILIVSWLFRKYGLPAAWIMLTIGFSVGLADQIASGMMKPYFGRLRPCYDPAISNLVYVLRGCGGRYSFASSHASTAFALAMSMWLHVRHLYKSVVYLFIWASAVSYSRVYVGVHYPADLVVGALVGILSAWICYTIFKFILLRLKYTMAEIRHEKEEEMAASDKSS